MKKSLVRVEKNRSSVLKNLSFGCSMFNVLHFLHFLHFANCPACFFFTCALASQSFSCICLCLNICICVCVCTGRVVRHHSAAAGTWWDLVPTCTFCKLVAAARLECLKSRPSYRHHRPREMHLDWLCLIIIVVSL